jgi:hemerythrin-like domain-containing protein
MRNSIQHLRAEHEKLNDLIHTADHVADRVLDGEHVDSAVIRGLTNFFMLYVHGIHREKEEDILFPLLNEKGLHHNSGCVGLMLAEHDESQNAFLTMERASEMYEQGSDEAAHAWSRAARIYCNQLRMHLRRENEVVFYTVEHVLSAEDDAQLSVEFARIDEKARQNGIIDRLLAAEEGVRSATA